MTYRVHKSEDGNVIVRSKEDNFTASYKIGNWAAHLAFNGNELEDFLQVNDHKEAAEIINLAKQALLSCKARRERSCHYRKSQEMIS